MVNTAQPNSECFIYFDGRFEINIEAHRLITMLEWEATKCDYLTPGKQSVNKMSNNGFKDYKTKIFNRLTTRTKISSHNAESVEASILVNTKPSTTGGPNICHTRQGGCRSTDTGSRLLNIEAPTSKQRNKQHASKTTWFFSWQGTCAWNSPCAMTRCIPLPTSTTLRARGMFIHRLDDFHPTIPLQTKINPAWCESFLNEQVKVQALLFLWTTMVVKGTR